MFSLTTHTTIRFILNIFLPFSSLFVEIKSIDRQNKKGKNALWMAREASFESHSMEDIEDVQSNMRASTWKFYKTLFKCIRETHRKKAKGWSERDRWSTTVFVMEKKAVQNVTTINRLRSWRNKRSIHYHEEKKRRKEVSTYEASQPASINFTIHTSDFESMSCAEKCGLFAFGL